MDLKFSELEEIALCPIGWPLGQIVLAHQRPASAAHLQAIALVKLSSEQLRRAAHIKARIEKLEFKLARALQNQSGSGPAQGQSAPASVVRSRA